MSMLLRCPKYVINFIDISLNLQVLTRDDAFCFLWKILLWGLFWVAWYILLSIVAFLWYSPVMKKVTKLCFSVFLNKNFPAQTLGKKLKPIMSIFYCFVSKNGTDQFKVFFKNLNIYAVCLPRWKLVSCKPLKTEFIMETVIDPFVQHQKYNTI